MKMIWLLLSIGLAFAAKLDRTYLLPPGSAYSGGSPGAIQVPIEPPKNKYGSSDKGLTTPELVIGINRVGPNQADDTFEDIISTPAPEITYKGNYFMSAANNKSSGYKQSSPLSKIMQNSINSDNQIIRNFDPSISTFHEKDRVYLPSYSGNKTHDVPFITLPSPFNTGMSISDKNKYIQPVIGSNEDTVLLDSNDHQFNTISSTSSENYNSTNANKNISPSSTVSKLLTTTPINTIKGRQPIIYSVRNQRPERVQAQADRQAVILNYEQSITPEAYAYSYDTSNGIHGNEEETATNGVKAKGSYSYIGDNGIFYQVEYTADENGFVPKGSHLPTAPPIPDAILKVIEQAAKDKEAGIYDDGSYNEEKYGYKKYQKMYPQINNIVNGVDFPSENENDNEKNYISYEFEDSYEDNGLGNAGESNDNELGNIDPIRIKYYNSNDMRNGTSLSKDTDKESESYQKQKPLTKLDPNMPLSGISDKTNLQTASGYDYFAPQTSFYEANTLKPFPNRFSGTENRYGQRVTYENNTEKVTAKPFLTPYVTRKYDDSEIKDYDENNGNDNKDMDNDANPSTETSEESYRDDKYDQLKVNDETMNTEGIINSRDFTPQDKLGQRLQSGDRIQNANDFVPIDKKGNIYQNSSNPSISLKQRVSYTTSTSSPTETPAGISPLDTNSTSGRGSSSFQTPSLSSITTLIDTSTKLSITTLPTYSIRQFPLDVESASVNPETDFISTTNILQTSRTIPTIFGMPYKLTTESSIIHNGQTSTENIITGPKQPQRFDPVSGYHY